MRAVAKEGKLIPRLMLPLPLSCDNGQIDGAAAGRVLEALHNRPFALPGDNDNASC